MPDVIPHLWHADKAEEAVAFYVSLLPDSRIDSVTALPADSPSGPAGVAEAMLRMVKLDIAGLQKACNAR